MSEKPVIPEVKPTTEADQKMLQQRIRAVLAKSRMINRGAQEYIRNRDAGKK
jgi:hypothetical protein